MLAEPIDSECKVVYLLAECRKLFPAKNVPFALNLFANWALHVDLSHSDTTHDFLERVDAYLESALDGNKDRAGEYQMFREFLLLESFKNQLRQFLQERNLPTGICDEDARWQEFVRHYAGVIEDGTLSCSAKAGALKHVAKVIFKKGRTFEKGDHYFPFALVWTAVLTDGRKAETEVNAFAHDDREFPIHNLRVLPEVQK